MQYYMAFDGGGSKLHGILFDEDYKIVSVGISGGINSNVQGREAAQEHFNDCVDQLFAGAAKKGVTIPRISNVLGSMGARMGLERIQTYCPADITESGRGGEGRLGVLCCGVTSGICALAGTGSDVYFMEDLVQTDVFGGWGYLLGDEGSGVWIGRKAIRKVLYAKEGKLPRTLLDEMMEEDAGTESTDGFVHCVYSAKSPAFQMGTFCKTVNRAAQAGDAYAIGILEQAGQALAEDVIRMVEKHRLDPLQLNFCTTGSVFEHCDAMRERFDKVLRERFPGVRILHPIFQPVVGCVLLQRVLNKESLDPEFISFARTEYSAFLARQAQ